MTLSFDQLEARLADIRRRIGESAARAGRNPAEVSLLAVTKTHPLDVIRMAYQAGIRDFGENRIEEASGKIETLSTDPDFSGVTWHMIGHIQSRKAKSTALLFDRVHSVDRTKIAHRLSTYRDDKYDIMSGLLEINLSGEVSKHGFDLSGWPNNTAQFDRFVSEIEPLLSLRGLRIDGLMTMAPFTSDEGIVRPIFQRLGLLQDALRDRFPEQSWTDLSMGMSGDFEIAIEEGATIIRLGTALFGKR